jgi:hypothetical protein
MKFYIFIFSNLYTLIIFFNLFYLNISFCKHFNIKYNNNIIYKVISNIAIDIIIFFFIFYFY